MSDFVWLDAKRFRGWPWPEDSTGKDPLYGADGWCRDCGTPQVPQRGDLVLQKSGLRPEGAWTPNWRFDLVCVSGAVAEQIVAAGFRVTMRPVGWPRQPAGEAFQLVIPVVGDRWFDPAVLSELTVARHGREGSRCGTCGVWRWMSVSDPPLVDVPELADVDVAASPEVFGSGWSTYREVLFRRAFAELLVAVSPRDFEIREPEWS
ncbi:hypothetical protein [Homoserinibacter sp. GY 40078]|uniref:hypothetical protein n=1 Tax=Homoserinibacter sp. GY 40078 TaxID=2603275 RepID=UPI0011CB80FF|nr:hypothetical protein [Homoserinibacter sp. GY 40078]TXK17714.1 hypothetical protein FVQ89_13005 [Homoserinibacter sp. GY 40078]